MNSFLFSAITVCLAAQCALAQYQAGPAYGQGYMQRKMAPSPQMYGQTGQQSYAPTEMYDMPAVYELSQPSYRAPSSASAVSQYEERQPLSSYAKPASYLGRQSASYGQSNGYSKPAPAKYEEQYSAPMPFAWGYDINDGYGGAQYHKENGDEYGKRTGSYGYTDAAGIYRQVDYVADENGFRATIKTNEPGTANESPADVELHAYEPPSNYYAQTGNSYSTAPSSYAAPKPAMSYSAAQTARPLMASYASAKPASSYQAARPAYPLAARHEQPQYSAYQPAKMLAPAKRY